MNHFTATPAPILADLPYAQRIKGGKKKEPIIIESLCKTGIPTVHAEDLEDKLGIDAWMTLDGQRRSLQIKFRENDDDIIFELILDIDRGELGRDYCGKSEYYLVANREGVGHMCRTADIKASAKVLLEGARKMWQSFPDRDFFKGNGWEMRVTNDRGKDGRHQRKLMAYFQPRLFEIVRTFKFNL